jgi:transcriptional regulator of acetoin/glycerol metabolism
MEGSQPRPAESTGLRDSLSETTARTILNALERHHWRISAAARELQISRSSLYERINRLGIKKPEP